ncbi:hypothetical protein WG219_12560 [Ectopseudomonas mendocina]|uniref:Uncharacterized protein n=1 Tax=Ectopseudomonas mendocina TaxID=300 RepID=A0ABZ2RG22_ECTME
MNVWLMLLLLAVVLSPLSLLMPSKRQRGRMDVRLEARRMGLAMQLSREQWPHWMSQTAPDSCPHYHRARRRGSNDSWCYWQSEPGQWLNKWREPCEDATLLEQLLVLPGDVYKVEANAKVLALWWGERGGSEALEKVAAFIKARA